MPEARFRSHMRWLRDSRYAVLPLNDAVEALRSGQLDRPTVAITFDDGFRNNVSVALPVLEEFGLPATIYLTTGLIGTRSTTWAGRITHALRSTPRVRLEYAGQAFEFKTLGERTEVNRALQILVKAQAPDRPQRAVTEIERRLDVEVDPDVTDDVDFEMLQPVDLVLAGKTGLVEFGAHSASHPILSSLDDAQLASEVTGSVRTVAELTRGTCRSFAFPNGQPFDYDARAIGLLRNTDVRTAVTTTQQENRAGADPLRLSRWVLGGHVGLPRLKATLFGLHPARLHSWLRGVPQAW